MSLCPPLERRRKRNDSGGGKVTGLFSLVVGAPRQGREGGSRGMQTCRITSQSESIALDALLEDVRKRLPRRRSAIASTREDKRRVRVDYANLLLASESCLQKGTNQKLLGDNDA